MQNKTTTKTTTTTPTKKLQNDQQLAYVTEVLDRVGMSNDAYLGVRPYFGVK